jgi:phosphoribosylformimino-5-aminoimidazole carboxamide ribotide isomerase
MHIIPVLDIQGGTVVRAVGGRRSEYRPLVSRLTSSTEPVAVASAIRDRFRLSEFYLADLDAIAGRTPDFEIYARLRAADFRLWVDSGIRDAADIECIADHVNNVVIASETLRCPITLFSCGAKRQRNGESVRVPPRRLRVAAKQLVFSLDLRNGEPLADAAWGTVDPLQIAQRVISAGIRRIIVLDLARVGTNAGVSEELIGSLTDHFPAAEFYVGGGIRGWDDVKKLEPLGVAGVLVASALHDGRLD